MYRTIATAALAAIMLAACQQQDATNITIDEGNSLNADFGTLPPDEGNEESAAANTVERPTTLLIPAALHGRWGMVPADCTSTRGDAKGLINVDDTSIKFYESVANLKEQRPAVATSFSGLFAFTGEGQNWVKVMTFTRTGNVLKRAEETGTFTYTRCA